MPKRDKDDFPVVPDSNKESDDLGFWTKNKEKGFYTHGTHESMQSREGGFGFTSIGKIKEKRAKCLIKDVLLKGR